MSKLVGSKERRAMRSLREKAVRDQKGLCYWCKEPMTRIPNDPRSVSAEHIKPAHSGGQTINWNIVAACRKCNSERHPELNQSGGGLYAKAEDGRHRSPFECLALTKERDQ